MIVTLGEIMLRLEVPGSRRLAHGLPGPLIGTFAGAEVNAAVAVAQLGGQVCFISSLPSGHPVADAAVRELRSLGVDTTGIRWVPHTRLGIYYYEPGATQRNGSVTYDRAGSAFALTESSQYPWEKHLTDASSLHISGITPAISATASAVARAAVAAATRRGLAVSLDVNFRASLWQWEPGTPPAALAARELTALAEQATVIFAGPGDGALLLGGPAPATPLAVFEALATRFPKSRLIATSQRGENTAGRATWSGLLYETATRQIHSAPTNEEGQPTHYIITDLVDRLGIGDAFAGALLWALHTSHRCKPDQALAVATAAGALKHGLAGDYLRLSLSEIDAAIAGANSGRVQR